MFIHYRPVDYGLKPTPERIALVPDSWRETLPVKEGLPELTVSDNGTARGRGHSCHGCVRVL